MTQIALPLFPATAGVPDEGCPRPGAGSLAAFDAAGFEIGWDYARHRLTPPADHLHGRHPVRQGWDAGRQAFGLRTLQPSRHVRRWLQLRLQAWLQDQEFEPVMVTPRFLALIEPRRCPVTREVLTHGDDAPSDAAVVRLQPQAGYAAGHLAVVSRRAAQACGTASAAELQAIVRRLRDGDLASVGGLDLAQWERLAALHGFVAAQAHERIASLPLRVLPPNRLRLLNPVQALQVMLTRLFLGQAYARRMTALGSLMPDADARRCYGLLMNAMLARRLAAGWSADPEQVRQVLEDAWSHPVVERRWEQLALRLRRADCERIVRLAAQRGLAGSGMHWLDDDRATEGWATATQAPGIPVQRPVRVPAGPGAHAPAQPVVARSRRAPAAVPPSAEARPVAVALAVAG